MAAEISGDMLIVRVPILNGGVGISAVVPLVTVAKIPATCLPEFIIKGRRSPRGAGVRTIIQVFPFGVGCRQRQVQENFQRFSVVGTVRRLMPEDVRYSRGEVKSLPRRSVCDDEVVSVILVVIVLIILKAFVVF